MGPWVIALVGVLIIAAGLAIPIKGPGGIGNSRDGDPAPRRSIPAIAVGFVVVAVGVVLAWQPWSGDSGTGRTAAVGNAAPTLAAHGSANPTSGPVASPADAATTPETSGSSDTSSASDANGGSPAGPVPTLAVKDLAFTIPASYYGSSYLDLSKPASSNKLEQSVSALDYSNGYTLSSGENGDVFGYTTTRPTSATDCVTQAQEHSITELETVLSDPASPNPLIKTNDAFCVSDKTGDVAWLQYVGPTPHDMHGNMELHFKMTLWKAQG